MLQEQRPAAEGDVTDGVNILFNTPPEYAVQAQNPGFLCVLHYLTMAAKSQEEGREQAVHRRSRTQSQRAGRKNCLLLHLIMSFSTHYESKLKPPQKKQQSYCRTEAYNFRVFVGAEKHVGIKKEEKTK